MVKKIFATLLVFTMLNGVIVSAETVKTDEKNYTQTIKSDKQDYKEMIDSQTTIYDIDIEAFSNLSSEEVNQIINLVRNKMASDPNLTVNDANKLAVKELKKLEPKKSKKVSSESTTYSAIWYTGTNLNPAEQSLVRQYPFSALIVKDCAEKALSESQSRYYSYTLTDGNGDAFRHSYWNALMVPNLGFSSGWTINWDYGYNLALKFSTAHEAYGSVEPAKTMDLYNNGVGARLSYYIRTTDTSVLISKIVYYIDQGWMDRISNGVIIDTDSTGKLYRF